MDTAELIRTSPLMTRADYDRAKDEGGIIFFDGTKNEWLSNFHIAPIDVFGYSWLTSEHAYQSQKFLENKKQMQIKCARTPGDAKRLGKTLKGMRPDWDIVKFDVMLETVRAKFTQYHVLGNLLKQTGDIPLVEGNYWHDNIWGFCVCNRCNQQGLNALGHTLMIVRDELRWGDKFTYNDGDVEITPA